MPESGGLVASVLLKFGPSRASPNPEPAVKQSLNYPLAKAFAAFILAIASLVLLASTLTVSASREAVQQPQTFQDKPGVQAPMKPIRPAAVVTVNFEELARAEKRRPSAAQSEAEALEIHPPLTIPEPDVPLSASEFAKPPLDVPRLDSGGALVG